VPFIEDNKEACNLFLTDEAQFWVRWFDPSDDMHDAIVALVMDGAHRYTVCENLAIALMRANVLRPSISITEMVQFCTDTNTHTLTHDMHDANIALVIDGAHRHAVCENLAIQSMRTNVLQPSISSITEIVNLSLK
jgi:hypothetical protein